MGVYDELANLEHESPTPIEPPIPKEQTKIKRTEQKKPRNKPKQNTKLSVGPEGLFAVLEEKPTEVITFRIAPSLLEEIDKIQYQLKSKYKTRITRYSVLGLALTSLIQDYQKNKERSLLVQKLIKNS